MTLRDVLVREMPKGAIAAALAVRELVRDDLAGAFAFVDDHDEDIAERVVVLLAIALAAQDGVPLPEHTASLLEDDLLVDAAIAARLEAAITGILAASATVTDHLRRYLALRLAAAGVTGVHIAALLLAVDDAAGAGRAALPAIVACVRANQDEPELINAVAAIVVGWRQSKPDFGDRLCAALPADVAHVLAAAARKFDVATAALLDAIR